MIKQNLSLALQSTLIAGCFVAVGCGGQVADDAGDETARVSSAQGELTIETRSDTNVAGRFSKDGVSVVFDFSTDAAGKHVRVSTVTGKVLVESLIRENGAHTTHVLGDRLLVESTGDGAAPTYSGDRSAEDALRDMPESTCLGGIEPALEAAKVNPALLPMAQPKVAANEGIGPQGFYGSPYASFYPCGTWTPPGRQTLCGTTFLGYTTLFEFNQSSGYAMVVFDGVMEYVPPARPGVWGGKDHGGWWWGQNVVMVNMSNTPIYFGH